MYQFEFDYGLNFEEWMEGDKAKQPPLNNKQRARSIGPSDKAAGSAQLSRSTDVQRSCTNDIQPWPNRKLETGCIYF